MNEWMNGWMEGGWVEKWTDGSGVIKSYTVDQKILY